MSELRALLAYDRWATERILGAVAALAPEELDRDLGSSFASVRATLVHMLGACWVWLERWRGGAPTSFPGAEALTTAAALRARFESHWEELDTYLDGLGPDAATHPVRYRLFDGSEDERPLGELMRHVVNHGTYHRGQLTTLLRQLGRVPPSTDYIRYLREKGA